MKFKEGEIVTFKGDRVKVVGLCIKSEWDKEKRYGVEYLDKVHKGEVQDYRIVTTAHESELKSIIKLEAAVEQIEKEVVGSGI